jgi:hypothetical protein
VTDRLFLQSHKSITFSGTARGTRTEPSAAATSWHVTT